MQAGVRFSIDALLLAAWLATVPAANKKMSLPPKGFLQTANLTPCPQAGTGSRRLLDLGTGCGAAAFALSLANPDLSALGVDMQEAALQAARRNAAFLGLADRFRAEPLDLRDAEACRNALPKAFFDIVMSNPPYRLAAKGRLPASEARRIALFDTGVLADAFCRAAAWSLRPGGRFGLIVGADRLHDFSQSLEGVGLALCRTRMVHPRRDEPARFALLEASQYSGDASGSALLCPDSPEHYEEAPLILHAGKGQSTRLTEEALAFCPYLNTTSSL